MLATIWNMQQVKYNKCKPSVFFAEMSNFIGYLFHAKRAPALVCNLMKNVLLKINFYEQILKRNIVQYYI
jgi:hypothetical protein